MTTDWERNGQRESTIGSPFERLDVHAATNLLDAHWGIQAHALERLSTENDDTFRVRVDEHTNGSGRAESSRYPFGLIVKFANPADDPAEIELQTNALLHARRRDPRLPLQRIIPSLSDELLPRVCLANGDVRIGRVLTFLPGMLLSDVPCSRAQLGAAGRALANLAAALADFEHPAAVRRLPWDLQQLSDLPTKLSAVADPSVRAEMTTVLERLLSDTLPRLSETRPQIIHNDFHGGNVIVDVNDPEFVTGILDFGDTVDSFLVADLAVAMSYAGDYLARAESSDGAADRVDAWAAADALRDGYCEITPLSDLERELLHPLAVGRLVQRYVLGSWLAATDPANAEYTAKNLRMTLEQFHRVKGTL